MKKIHLYLLSMSILILLLMYSFNCFAQNEEKFTWGEMWLTMDSADKVIFFMGVREGMIYSSLDLFTEVSTLSNTQKELLLSISWKKLSGLQQNLKVLIDMITSLYKSPENSYIRFSTMIDIAIKKLKGESIDKLLEKRRKEAYEDSD